MLVLHFKPDIGAAEKLKPHAERAFKKQLFVELTINFNIKIIIAGVSRCVLLRCDRFHMQTGPMNITGGRSYEVPCHAMA